MIKRGGALLPVFPLGASGHEDSAKSDNTVSTTQVRSNGFQLAEIAKLLDKGTVRVAVDSQSTFADAAAAHERCARGHLKGKIELTVDLKVIGPSETVP